jgi:hypothetical protein
MYPADFAASSADIPSTVSGFGALNDSSSVNEQKQKIIIRTALC